MELLYRVKPDDSVVGPVERDRAHAEGILHRSGMIFLVRSDGRILIQRRNAARETYPESYDSSCSFHVTFGESYEEAAKRELIEEIGLSAPVTYLGKFAHYDPPENEMVAVSHAIVTNRYISARKSFRVPSSVRKKKLTKS